MKTVSLIPIRRGNVRADAICFVKKAHFEARRNLHGKFLGEPAMDAGGPVFQFIFREVSENSNLF